MSGQLKDTGRLLVLDDEQDVAATICMMASTVAFEAQHTGYPEVFLERFVTWAPTHVAVDLQLTGSDGIDVIHRLAEIGCNAAVIIISGLGDRILESSGRAAVENGLRLAGTLSKPFSRSELLSLLAADVPGSANASVRSRGRTFPAVSDETLANALREEAFITHYQPKIDCSTGELTGFECLARWPLGSGDMVPPDQFIAMAERSGRIHELTRQIYRYALANLPVAIREGRAKLALNLSPINLDDESFPRWLLDECREYDVAPSQIILELTETASMANPLALLESLTQFRIRGFPLSIDDFGVGHSSLVQLARLPFSELKVDQMFVRNLAESAESRKIVTAVVSLAHSLGLNAVAEGVEDARALEFLKDIGCHEAQGYFIARPMDIRSINEWAGFSWGGGA